VNFGLGGFASVEAVRIEVYTSAYRVAGTIHTPFRRVAEILTQLSSGHLAVERAQVSELALEDAPVIDAGTALVSLEEILVLLAPDLGGEARAEMRVAKQPVDVGLGVPPLHVRGTLHVPLGSDPAEGLANLADRFMPMTDATISSTAHPHLARRVPILAVRRDRSHIIVRHDGSGPAHRGAESRPDPADPDPGRRPD
jgi:hypothetical protein